MILIFTGNGKGKTTAALGQAMRALGQDWRVLMIQFIKSRTQKSGEELFVSKFKIPEIKFKIIKAGVGFVGILSDQLPREEHEKAAKNAWEVAKQEIISKNWDLVILDEINVALSMELLPLKDVVDFFKQKDKLFKADVILTGRNAPKNILQVADLITEMKEVRHPYQKGGMAKKGIEY